MRYISKTVFDRVYSQFKKVGLQPKKEGDFGDFRSLS